MNQANYEQSVAYRTRVLERDAIEFVVDRPIPVLNGSNEHAV